MGEENTKFFHAMVTERYRRNSISSLQLPDGHVVSDHDQMAAVAWSCYKQRMGTSREIDMQFNLPDLITPVQNLEGLVKPFTTEEMELVVRKCPMALMVCS